MSLPEPLQRLTCPEDRVLFCELGAAREDLPRPGSLTFSEGPVPRDGAVYGLFDGGSVKAELQAARLVKVEVTFFVKDEELERFAEAIASHWGLTLKRRGKARRFSASRRAEGAVAGTLSLQSEEVVTGGDPLYRISLVSTVDAPQTLVAPPPVPVDALAEALATPVELLTAASRSLIPGPLRAELMKRAPLELQQLTKNFLRLVDLHLHADQPAYEEALAGLHRSQGGWLGITPALRVRFVNTLSGTKPRAELVDLVVDAFDFGDAAAVRELTVVAAALRASSAAPAGFLKLAPHELGGSDPGVRDAVFAVLTSGLPLTEVALSAHDQVDAQVVSRALTPHVGPPPDFTTSQLVEGMGKRAPNEEGWRQASVLRAQLFAQARRIDDAVFLKLLQRWSYDEAALFLVADERVVTPAVATYRLGRQLVSFKRSPKGKQLIKTEDLADDAAASAKLAKKAR